VIVRILGEGQFDVPDDALAELNDADEALVAAVDAGDEGAFGPCLADLQAGVHQAGTPVAMDHIEPSDMVLPAADATLAEVRALLGKDGLIPG
jgi:hypothetical protein